MDPNDRSPGRGTWGEADPPGNGRSKGDMRERQITMFNRKAVVALAAIAGMTVMVVSFAFNAPRRGATGGHEELSPAEQSGANEPRRNYLASPPDTTLGLGGTDASVQPAAGSRGQGEDTIGVEAPDLASTGAAPVYDPYATPAYTTYPVPGPIPNGPVEPGQPSPRELAFERAMRCGIRSCPADSPAASTGRTPLAAEYPSRSPVAEIQAFAEPTDVPNPPAGPEPRDRYEAFLRSADGDQTSANVVSHVQRPVSPYQIMAGTLIPVTLVTAINSDLTGEVVAQVTRDVYDTQQHHLLIPAGSKVLGRVDNQTGLGQARVNIAWHRLILPNNNSLTLPGFGGVDARGAAGIRDRVDNHYTRTYVNAMLLSAITAGVQLSQPQAGNVYTPVSAGQVAAGLLGQQMSEVSSEIIRRNMQVGPTLEVRQGFKFSIYVRQDLVLAPYEHDG